MESKTLKKPDDFAQLKFKFKEKPGNMIEVMIDGIILGQVTYIIEGHRRIYRTVMGTFDRRWMMAIRMYKTYKEKQNK